MKNKVAFIGPESIHAAFSTMNPAWDFQKPVETLADFEEAINADPETNPPIASDTSVIIFFSRLFEGANKDLFAEMAAFVTPYSAVCILFPESDGEDLKNTIKFEIANKQEALAQEYPDSGYSNEVPFYFVAYETPLESLSEALGLYVRDPLADSTARANILATLSDDTVRALESENDEAQAQAEFTESNEGVVIPDRDPNAKGRIIAVTSSKGGSGKSTVSMLLAAYIAKGSRISVEKGVESKPLKVCVVDLDVRDGQLGFLNGAQNPNIVNILTTGSLSHAAIAKGVYHSTKMECDFIFAAKRPKYVDAIPPDFYASVINELRSMYDYIIVDTSVNYLDPLLEEVAYPMADKIVFVTDLSISSIFGMRRWLNETTMVEDNKAPIDIDKIGIVANKVMKDVNMSMDKIKSAADGRPILTMYPSAPGLITLAANTTSLEQVLNMKQMNVMTKNLADSIVDPTGYKLSQIPFMD